MEHVFTMVDSILNALWWPWSRNSESTSNQPTVSSTTTTTVTTTTTIDTTQFSDSISSNDFQISSSSSSPSASYYIPFGSLFNPFVTNDTGVNASVSSTLPSNFSEFFTSINNFTTNSSLLSYSNYTATFGPSLNLSVNDTNLYNGTSISGSGEITGENFDYYYNFGENATSINHSYIFMTTRTNDTSNKIFFDSAEGESTFYLIQIVVTAIVLGIVILATVIGEYYFNLFKNNI